MLLYTDIISGDEMFSDAFPVKVVDDIVYEVDCQTITVKPGADVDIGANPSTEEQEEAMEDGAISVNNVVHSFRLQKTTFNKKDYTKALKDYMKVVKKQLEEADPDRVAGFESGAQKYAAKIIKDFSNFDFYTGESMDINGMVALLNYRDDGITPYFTFWKDGLKVVKL